MEQNGIFSAGNSTPDDTGSGGVRGVDVQSWERRNHENGGVVDWGDGELAKGDRLDLARGNFDEIEGQGRLGEIVEDTADRVTNRERIGMGGNDLMSEVAEESDEALRNSNKILESDGWAANKIAGRGADSVTDNEVVKELVEKMESDEDVFRKTGDVEGFYNDFAERGRMYRLGESARADSEVEG